MVSFCTQTACKVTIFFGHMQVLWRKLNWGMWFLTVLGRKNARFFSRSSLGGTQNKERHPNGCLSLLLRVHAWITKRCRACGGRICNAQRRKDYSMQARHRLGIRNTDTQRVCIREKRPARALVFVYAYSDCQT